MKNRILVCLVAVVTLIHEVQICNACVLDDGTKAIAMCTVGSATGSAILLTTPNASVNTCVCTIEAHSGPFVILNTAQPTSSDCGTRIDITNENGSISTTYQCQQFQLYKPVGVSIVSGEITLHKQSNSTEDDINYCLFFTGTSVTISCYGTDSQPPTTTTTEPTSTTTVRSSTSTTAVPKTTGIIATPATTTTQQLPTTTTSVTSYGTSMSTTAMTSGTTNHQGDTNNMTVGRKNNDLDLAQPKSPDCGTRIDITNNSGIISKTFQCQQLQLYEITGVPIVSVDITFHKQSNSTEDDMRYCLLFTGSPITISCYGTDLPHPTTTTKETISTTTVRSPTTTSTTVVPTTTGIIAISATTTTQQPPSKSILTSSSSTSKHTMLLTLSTTSHQGDNEDVNLAVIIAPTLGGLCVTGVVIVVIFLCRRYLKNANKTRTEDERNDSYANLSNDREGNSDYETLNNMQIISVSVVTVMYENVAC